MKKFKLDYYYDQDPNPSIGDYVESIIGDALVLSIDRLSGSRFYILHTTYRDFIVSNVDSTGQGRFRIS